MPYKFSKIYTSPVVAGEKEPLTGLAVWLVPYGSVWTGAGSDVQLVDTGTASGVYSSSAISGGRYYIWDDSADIGNDPTNTTELVQIGPTSQGDTYYTEADAEEYSAGAIPVSTETITHDITSMALTSAPYVDISIRSGWDLKITAITTTTITITNYGPAYGAQGSPAAIQYVLRVWE